MNGSANPNASCGHDDFCGLSDGCDDGGYDPASANATSSSSVTGNDCAREIAHLEDVHIGPATGFRYGHHDDAESYPVNGRGNNDRGCDFDHGNETVSGNESENGSANSDGVV